MLALRRYWAVSQISGLGDTSDDILSLANVAIGKINQTNPGVVLCINSVPTTNLRRSAENGEFS